MKTDITYNIKKKWKLTVQRNGHSVTQLMLLVIRDTFENVVWHILYKYKTSKNQHFKHPAFCTLQQTVWHLNYFLRKSLFS